MKEIVKKQADASVLNLAKNQPPITHIREEELAIKCVQDNLNALENRDLSAYLQSIDIDVYTDSDLDFIKRSLQALFERFMVEYELESAKIKSFAADRAEIKVVQTARCNDPDFADHRCIILHQLTKTGKRWLITSSETLQVDYSK